MPKSEPRYVTIFNDLKTQITSGALKADDQLPTELQLAKAYNVSRITSKRALTELEAQNFIYRQQGSGSFVQPHHALAPDKQLLFVLPFPADAGLGDYASGISQAASEHGYQAVTMDTRSFTQLTPAELRQKYAGLIYLPQDLYQEAELLYQLKLDQFPIVLLDKAFPELGLPVVTADNLDGGRQATASLIQTGHQRILFYAHSDHGRLPSSVYERYFGYLQALHQAHLTPVAPMRELPALNQLTATAWLSYLDSHAVTAIVVENDLIAIQLMNDLRAVDATIWQRLSIIGFDNIQAASLTYPTLSTVAQDFQGMGQRAVKLLLTAPTTPTVVHLPIKLIARESTHAAPHKED
ncbi:GntR family transcriptional regulator [Lactiplantibacillus modestisalitolerans]|uniref:GntR family transcriptional regulator n=1 Tax=Lactiplantibacillus modestisalitolerans TaxID=1457219 RepID=A0ABV5WTL0_9LACO|nr:LacI family DNA-binding transcriptional regulator [Lactiplantibacillus modestisalitolerans]